MREIRVFLFTFFLIIATTFSEGLNVKLGLNVGQSFNNNLRSDLGIHSKDLDKIEHLDNTFSLDLSYDLKITKTLDFGVGGSLGTIKDGIQPIYGQLKYNYTRTEETNQYLIGKFGYSFTKESETLKKIIDSEASIELSNGPYAGIGVGVEENDLIVEILYEMVMGKVTYEDSYLKIEDNFNTSRITLSLGYNMGRVYGDAATRKREKKEAKEALKVKKEKEKELAKQQKKDKKEQEKKAEEERKEAKKAEAKAKKLEKEKAAKEKAEAKVLEQEVKEEITDEVEELLSIEDLAIEMRKTMGIEEITVEGLKNK